MGVPPPWGKSDISWLSVFHTWSFESLESCRNTQKNKGLKPRVFVLWFFLQTSTTQTTWCEPSLIRILPKVILLDPNKNEFTYVGFPEVQVHVPQKPQKKRVDIIFFLLVDFKNGFVSMKGCRKRGLPVGYYYFLPKIDRVLMLQSFLFFTICTPKTTKAKTRKRLQLMHLSL